MAWVFELGLQLAPTKFAYTPAKVWDKEKEVSSVPAPKGKQKAAKMKEVISSAAGTSTGAPLSKINIPSGPQRKTRAHEIAHARYNLFVYGCTDTVYRVISSSENGSYAKFLQTQDFLAEHPRQDLDSLVHVRRLKPFWSLDDPCYHWMEDESDGGNDEFVGETDESESMNDDDMYYAPFS